MFAPVEINGSLFIDGGMAENVPLSPLKDFGAGIIIGVNLLRHRKYSRPKNIVDVLTNSFDIVNHRISVQPEQNGWDVLIEPDLSDYFMGDIKKWKEISDQGYRETLKHVSEIKNLQHRVSYKDLWQKFKNIFIK